MFKKSNFMADELVEVKVHLCSSALLRLDMSKLVILFVKEVRLSSVTYVHSTLVSLAIN